jgi:hypothetical protein
LSGLERIAGASAPVVCCTLAACVDQARLSRVQPHHAAAPPFSRPSVFPAPWPTALACVSVLSLKELSMKKLLVLAMACLCGLGLLSSSALAADSSFVRAGAFAEQAPDGAPAHQRHIAVLWATGDTYVADVANDQVIVYRPDGSEATLLTSLGSGVLSDPDGVAIDQDTGSVYVSDASGVRKFDSDGAPTPTFTVDPAFGPVSATGALSFDQGANQLLVADTAGGVVRRFSASGAVVSSFNGSAGAGSPGAFTGLFDIATDSTGDVLIIDAVGDPNNGGTSRLERYSSAGVWESTIGPSGSPPVAVGVVPASDDVIVAASALGLTVPSLHRFTSAGVARPDLAVDSSVLTAILTGVAVDDGPEGRLSVATDVSTGFSFNGWVSVQVYAQKLLATVAAAPASQVTPFTATLNATVNPEGAETSFHLELAQGDGTTWQTIDGDGDGDESAGLGAVAVAVSDTADGLRENTSYRVRVVANRDGETSVSAATTFTTGDAPDPTTTIAPVTEIADDHAKLSGVVNPHGGPGVTRYHFEYSADGGNSWSETPDGLIGDGTADVTVSRTIAGLDPGRAYKARLVATKETTLVVNSTPVDFVADSGDSCPNAPVRAQQHARRLPFCGAYEMVSPVDKDGGFTDYTPQTQLGFIGLSVDGSAAVFSSYRAFADSKSGMPATYYSKRTSTGWAVNTASPPPVHPNPSVLEGTIALWGDASDDLSAGLATTADNYDPTDANGNNDAYRLTTGGQVTLASRGNGAQRTTTSDGGALEISADGRDVYFQTSSHLVPEDADRMGGTDVYVRTGDHTRLLNVDGNGVPLSKCGSVLGGGYSHRHAVSQDGSRAFFTVPNLDGVGDPDCSTPRQIYVRLGDGEVVHVSASQRATPDPDGPKTAVFEGAAADGSRVIFSSPERLTDDAQPGGGVYSFDVATRELRLLVGPTNDALVIKVSDSAKTVYFLTANTAIPGVTGQGLYAYRDGEPQVDLIALDPASLIQGDLLTSSEISRFIAVNGDDQMAFATVARLTAFDNRGFKEVYLYDRQDGLTCVSCDPNKQRPADGRVLGDAGLPRQWASTERPSFSRDGKLLFDSADRLVKDDVNSRNDVYLYADGRVSLISGGRGDAGAYPHGISDDGKTVLFTSYDGLVPQDRDGDQDVYAVRFEGGFLAPSSVQTAPCLGDSCQAPPSGKPAGVTPASQSAGAGDPAPARRPAKLRLKSLALPNAAARKAALRSGVVKVQLTLAGSGVAGVRLDGRVSGKSRRVASVSRPVRAGSGQRVTFRLKLSVAARRELARHGRLALAIRPVIDGRAKSARSLTLASAASTRSGR